MQGLFALHRSWQKFDELQHEWHNKDEDLVSKNKLLEADAAFVKVSQEEKDKFKEEAESSRNVASEATKEVKLIKEELWTCQLDREYHKDVAEKKTALVDTLQNDLQAQTEKCGELTAENNQQKKLLEEQAEELMDYKDDVDICFYMLWKHNRNVDFSYLGDAYAAEEAKCLERLAEEEAEAAAVAKETTPQDPQA